MQQWQPPENREDKSLLYSSLVPQIADLVAGEQNLYANLANVSAALKQAFNWWWVGFYLVDQNELILGPFQGPVACTRISKGKGVCGSAWAIHQSIIVPNVQEFPGHIACSSESKSEIVVPVFKHESVVAVLDVDSEYLNHFDETDARYLEKIAAIVSPLF